MHNAFGYKVPTYIYEKGFNLSSVLENLQGYKLVTGQIPGLADRDERGAAYAELLTIKGDNNTPTPRHLPQKITVPEEYCEKEAAEHPEDDKEVEEEVTEEQDFFGFGTLDRSTKEDTSNEKSDNETQGSDLFGLVDYASDTESVSDQETKNKTERKRKCEQSKEPQDRNRKVAKRSSAFSGVAHYEEDENEYGEKCEPEATETKSAFQLTVEQASREGGAVVPNLPTAAQLGKRKGNARKGGKRVVLPLPDFKAKVWDSKEVKYKSQTSSLDTYKCWKCGKVGHIADDCTAYANIPAATPAAPHRYKLPQLDHEDKLDDGSTKCIYTPKLRKLYQRCRAIGEAQGACCVECSSRSNLAYCLDCNSVYCDSNGHLTDHLRSFPSHKQLYSYKLQRQVKCSKATCEETSVYKLYACHDCLNKAFDQYYSMLSAAWSRAGLKLIPNSMACKKHFQWHRLNCLNADDLCSRPLVEKDKLEQGGYNGQLSEFFF